MDIALERMALQLIKAGGLSYYFNVNDVIPEVRGNTVNQVNQRSRIRAQKCSSGVHVIVMRLQ